MELNRKNWTIEDIEPFEEYLFSLSKGEEKASWEKRIVNTNLPCLAVPATEVKKIVAEIAKGNAKEYIDLWLWNNFTETEILGGLIVRERDFSVMKGYLDKYASMCDCWATSDTLKFKINPKNKDAYFQTAGEYVKSQLPFVKRIGLVILLKLLNYPEYLEKTFDIMDSFSNEEDYYVNMMVAWLFAECFTKQREKTFEYLQRHKLNKFQINKGISKCRDSFRISPEDKETLKSYRK